MQSNTEHFDAFAAFNDYLVQRTFEYWTAVSFPALYFAKYL